MMLEAHHWWKSGERRREAGAELTESFRAGGWRDDTVERAPD